MSITITTDQYVTQANATCLYSSELVSDFNPEMLSPQYWQVQNAITGTAQGRGTTWFIRYSANDSKQSQHWVLRHYYRGGLIGKLIKDSYLFNGIENSRAMREFALLKQMQQWQLPAPKPVACRITRHGLLGLFYRADLLSSRIENAQDLVAILSKENINDELWRKIGATIKRFHDHGIYHHDLNSHNILIDKEQQVYLIDFDRGELRKKNTKKKSILWKESNMSRLQRSFLKESKQLSTFHFTDNNWQTLLSGYSNKVPD
jgi:3-deoxy-D-manno-octulosonic acid kinase